MGLRDGTQISSWRMFKIVVVASVAPDPICREHNLSVGITGLTVLITSSPDTIADPFHRPSSQSFKHGTSATTANTLRLHKLQRLTITRERFRRRERCPT